MIRLELEGNDELMRLYQVIMAGKFADGNDAMLADNKLANVANNVVDRVISEARLTHNEALVDMMEQGRRLQKSYPQFHRIDQYVKAQSDWADKDDDQKKAILERAAAPLTIDRDMLAEWLSES